MDLRDPLSNMRGMSFLLFWRLPMKSLPACSHDAGTICQLRLNLEPLVPPRLKTDPPDGHQSVTEGKCPTRTTVSGPATRVRELPVFEQPGERRT